MHGWYSSYDGWKWKIYWTSFYCILHQQNHSANCHFISIVKYIRENALTYCKFRNILMINAEVINVDVPYYSKLYRMSQRKVLVKILSYEINWLTFSKKTMNIVTYEIQIFTKLLHCFVMWCQNKMGSTFYCKAKINIFMAKM